MDDLATLWKKTNKRALRMTWKGWSLYDDAKEKEGVANALNDALIGAALVLWKRLREKGPLRGEALADAIDDALMAKWTGTAHRYRGAGADDTEVMERAGKALRKFLRDNPIAAPAAEGVGMRGILRTLEEAKFDMEGLIDKMTRKPQKLLDAGMIYNEDLTDEEQQFIGKLPTFTAQELWGERTSEGIIGAKFATPQAPRWFVVELRQVRSRVLVDTEGYDYVRYGTRLER
jgi:hypothetical protein